MTEISDSELKKRLEEYIYEVPPITITTRNVLIKKLKQLDENNQNLKETIPNKSNHRRVRHTLKSTPSVTFNPYEENIEVEKDDSEEADVDQENYAAEYKTVIAYGAANHTLNNQDFMAEKGRYQRKKSPAVSRFQNNAATPLVDKTSNYFDSEIYPREIHMTQRRSKIVTSADQTSEYGDSGEQTTEFIKKNESNKELANGSYRSIFRIIVAIAIALFIVILYEYLTRSDKQVLLS